MLNYCTNFNVNVCLNLWLSCNFQDVVIHMWQRKWGLAENAPLPSLKLLLLIRCLHEDVL